MKRHLILIESLTTSVADWFVLWALDEEVSGTIPSGTNLVTKHFLISSGLVVLVLIVYFLVWKQVISVVVCHDITIININVNNLHSFNNFL